MRTTIMTKTCPLCFKQIHAVYKCKKSGDYMFVSAMHITINLNWAPNFPDTNERPRLKSICDQMGFYY